VSAGLIEFPDANPFYLGGEELPEEVDHVARATQAEEIAAIEPLRELSHSPGWLALVDWLGTQETEAIERLVNTRNPVTVTSLQARIALLREIADLPETTLEQIARLTSEEGPVDGIG